MKKFITVAVLVLTACETAPEKKTVKNVTMHLRVDTSYTVRSFDGYHCLVSNPPIVPGDTISCNWEYNR